VDCASPRCCCGALQRAIQMSLKEEAARQRKTDPTAPSAPLGASPVPMGSAPQQGAMRQVSEEEALAIAMRRSMIDANPPAHQMEAPRTAAVTSPGPASANTAPAPTAAPAAPTAPTTSSAGSKLTLSEQSIYAQLWNLAAPVTPGWYSGFGAVRAGRVWGGSLHSMVSWSTVL